MLGRGAMGGQFMQVLNVNAFTPLEAYQQGVRAFLDGIKSIPPAPGFDEVLVPGDYEHRSRVQRLAHGVRCAGYDLPTDPRVGGEIETFLWGRR